MPKNWGIFMIRFRYSVNERILGVHFRTTFEIRRHFAQVRKKGRKENICVLSAGIPESLLPASSLLTSSPHHAKGPPGPACRSAARSVCTTTWQGPSPTPGCWSPRVAGASPSTAAPSTSVAAASPTGTCVPDHPCAALATSPPPPLDPPLHAHPPRDDPPRALTHFVFSPPSSLPSSPPALPHTATPLPHPPSFLPPSFTACIP